MFSKFFIDRPILSNVIAILTMILGAVALAKLPVAQYPEISPPTVSVRAAFPGASATVLADAVAAPIEEQVNGVEGMMYMSSKCANDGSYNLTVTFEVGTNLDMAAILVQNRVSVALPRLPEEVRRQGVTVQKRSTSILLVIALSSPTGDFDDLYISNFATLRLKDELARIKGVGEVQVYGAGDYGMRVWLDPEKMKAFRLSAQDVISAIAEQNVQVAAGQLGQPPIPDDQNLQLTIQTLGRLKSVQEFEDIVIKSDRTTETGRALRVKDVARVDLGAKTYDLFAQKTGSPAGVVAIYLMPGANALQVAKDVKAAMERKTKEFPDGLVWEIPFDTTRFVEAAIDEVYVTLIEAAILVLLVIMVFLQDWRATLVPATTVPVTILGAFIAMSALGYTVNLVTLFGIILAIGIVVDDAIIIVEGAAHHMEKGANSHDAAVKAMSELFGPIIGITLVLIAVFLPAAFMGGVTGQLYRQFALVIAATAVISAINAATLKPTQCAMWLKPPSKAPKGWFYRNFNRAYDWLEGHYAGLVGWMVRNWALSLVLFALILAGSAWGFTRLPSGFLPQEDQGYCIIAMQLPEAASQARMREAADKLNAILKDVPGVESWVTFGGLSILDGVNVSNAATIFVTYTDWKKRPPGVDQQAIVGQIQGRLMAVQEAMALVLVPPAIQGVGQAGGFEMLIQDRGGLGVFGLEEAAFDMMMAGRGQSGLGYVASTFSARVPQLFLEVDRVKAKTMGLTLSEVFGALQAYLGSAYVNDFNAFGRTYQVRLQADAAYRLTNDDVKNIEVRNKNGEMVSLGSLASLKEIVGPQVLTRYNLFPAATLMGAAAPGVSSGEALTIMEQMAAARLPASMGYEWTGMSFQEKKVGSEVYFIFGLALLLVYLLLAAQYESWSAPAAVILSVPLALCGTLAALWVRGMDNNVYTQIGLVLLIALASKNAILIVEFARELRKGGMSIAESAVQASRSRFRPILMTSFAFILGVAPLLTASGAGAASRQALGTAVFGGMIASTVLAVGFTPVFYAVIQRVSEMRKKKPEGGEK